MNAQKTGGRGIAFGSSCSSPSAPAYALSQVTEVRLYFSAYFRRSVRVQETSGSWTRRLFLTHLCLRATVNIIILHALLI